MNGQPAKQGDAPHEPRWTARLDECRPAASPAVAAWLLETGLLTERLRACCDGEPGLSVVTLAEAPIADSDAAALQAAGLTAFVREIELTCDGRPWVFAQTLLPQATLIRRAAERGEPALAHERRLRDQRAARRSARARARAARVHPPRGRRSPLSSRAARARRSAGFALGTP